MKQINSPADFEEMLQAERAVALVVLQNSDWAEEFGRDWEPKIQGLVQQNGKQVEMFVLKADAHPYTWKWVNQAMDTLEVDEISTDCAFELKKGELIGWMSESGQCLNRRTEHNIFDAGLLKILCCPETHQGLKLATALVLEKLNQQIGEGHLRNRAGRVLRDKIDGGLVRTDGRWLYPVRENIPVLLVDEAVPLNG